MTPSTVRLSWRPNDPAEELRERWTKVHVVRREDQHCSDARALCGLLIPDFPYMADFGADIPDAAPICRKNHPPSLWRAENDPITEAHRALRKKDPREDESESDSI